MIYTIGITTLIPDNEIKPCSPEFCVESLEKMDIIGLDIETTQKFGGKYKDEGLDPYLSEIVMLQIGDEENQFVIDVRTTKIDFLKPILENENKVFVGHNLKFEYKHLLHKMGVMIETLYDTMIAEQVIYNGLYLPMGLKALVKRYFNIDMDKNIRSNFANIRSRPFSTSEIIYGAKDIIYPLKIKEEQKVEIKNRKVSNCIKLEMKFIPVLGDIEYKGMFIDEHAWKKLYAFNKVHYDIQKKVLDKLVTDNANTLKGNVLNKFVSKQLDFFDDKPKCTVQWTSSKQVIEVLHSLGLYPEAKSKSTGKISPTADAKVLKNIHASLRVKNDKSYKGLLQTRFLVEYIYFKELEQMCTTFGKDFLIKYVNPITGRLHSDYKQIVSTGRISSSNPNLQNIPSDGRFRKCFTAPDLYKIVNADYSGQEQIILANKSREPKLREFYESGESDMHSFIARAIFPELRGLSLPEIKKAHIPQRQIAKGAGFAINYGGDGHTIAKNLNLSNELGNEVYEEYFTAFPQLRDYFKKVQGLAHKRSYIRMDNVTGRIYTPKKGISPSKIDRLALNYPIQGEAGSITKLATVLLRRKLKEFCTKSPTSTNYIYKYLKDVYITNIVHDEINVECKHYISNKVSILVEEAMEESANIWCKDIPMKAKAVVGNYWAH